MNGKNNNWSGETVISVKKIWQNIKQFWWVILIFVVAFALLLVRDMRNTYTADQAMAARDTYQSSTLLYYPHRDNEQGLAFVVLCESEMVINQVNACLESNGFTAYGSDDVLNIDWIGNSFGLSLVGEGEARMLCMAEAFGKYILSCAYEVTGNEGSILNEASVVPCLVKSSGAIVLLEDASQRQAAFSLKDFLTWKRLMVMCAAVFMGFAVIFVAIILDSKIRTREELEAVFDLPCIGTVKKKKKESWGLSLDLLVRICEKKQIMSLALVSPRVCENVKEIKTEIEKAVKAANISLQIIVGENIAVDGSAIEVCENADGLVLMVSANRDRLDQVSLTVKNMALLEKTWLGYILFE